MSEERLIEIAKEICGPNSSDIWAVAYVASLGDTDRRLLIEYIRSHPKYDGVNFCDALYDFSRNYLISKGISLETNNEYLSSNGFSKTELHSAYEYLDRMLGDGRTQKTGRDKK